MRRLVFLVLMLFILNPSISYLYPEVDFVELKKQEEERRKKTKKSKAVVNLKYINRIKQKKEKYVLFQIQPSIKSVDNQEKGTKGLESKKVPKGIDPTKTKEYWQNLKNNLQRSIKELELLIKEQQMELNKLHDDLIITDLPSEEDLLRVQINGLSEALKSNKIKLDVHRKDLELLYERARKAGVPPGWVR